MKVQPAWLNQHGLPARWAHRPHFVILETDFGLGHRFLTLWDAWRQDAARCEQLHVVSLVLQPPSRATLGTAHASSELPALAAALLQAWPPLTPNLHCLDFEEGRVQLTLAMARQLGDMGALLRTLRLQADAICLEPAHTTQRWSAQLLKAVGRLAAAEATAVAHSVAAELQASLCTAGFELQPSAGLGGPDGITLARYAPRHPSQQPKNQPPSHPPRHPSRHPSRRMPALSVETRSAVVVGAGLAGAAVAKALAQQGLAVTVLEREAAPAHATSGNPAGLFHGTVNAADGHYARLYRAAALVAAVEYRSAIVSGQVSGQVAGLLRLVEHEGGVAGLQALLQQLGLPADYVEVLDSTAASRRAGVPLQQACWHYPGGGWLSPPSWVQHALRTPGIRLRGNTEVAALVHDGDVWWLLDLAGAVIERSALVVLANAADTQRLLTARGHTPWPLRQTRGQVTHWRTDAPSALALPVAGDGYALPLAGGLLCGATRQDDDPDMAPRRTDHLHNIARLQQLIGLQAPADECLWQGRVGQRLHSDDKLPIAGAVPSLSFAPGQRLDQVRLLPRETGLFVLTALGARGLTLAPLLGRLVAAQATGTPWPLEQELADAVDPARWIVRAARARTRPGAET